jgi:hypothetical protein
MASCCICIMLKDFDWHEGWPRELLHCSDSASSATLENNQLEYHSQKTPHNNRLLSPATSIRLLDHQLSNLLRSAGQCRSPVGIFMLCSHLNLCCTASFIQFTLWFQFWILTTICHSRSPNGRIPSIVTKNDILSSMEKCLELPPVLTLSTVLANFFSSPKQLFHFPCVGHGFMLLFWVGMGHNSGQMLG